MRLAVLLVALGACYQPTVPTGLRCSQSGDCPVGQLCDQVRNVCGAVPLDASQSEGPDASDATLPIDAPVLGAWSPPADLVAINTTAVETDPAISSDGLELFFATDRPAGGGIHDVYRSTRASVTAAFGAPALVVELSTMATESSPHLTADGLTIYFARDGQIYRATRPDRQSPFGVPVHEAALSSTLSDSNPAVSHDGLTASTTRQISATDRDLYVYTRASTAAAWSAGQLMTALQTPLSESGAEFTADPLELYFHSDRASGTDLYRATRSDVAAAFESPTVVAELSTVMGQESDPSVNADRRIIVFERSGNLMIATR